MKLKNKLASFNIITKLVLMIILLMAFPYIVKKVIYTNADRNLLEKKEKLTNNLDIKGIKDFLLANDSTEVYGSFSNLHNEFIQLEVSSNQKKIEKNIFFNDKRRIENKTAEFRILQHNFTYNSVNYKFEIGSNVKEIDDLIVLLHYTIIITFLVISIFMFVIDGAYISFLLKPFYKIVETKIRLINEPENFIHIPINSKISEFNDLDMALNEMMHRIKGLFLKEKQFIGNVSHELLTPISVLKNRFENLIQNQYLADTVVDKISDSLLTLDSMKKVIANLLLISKIDNKQYKTDEIIDFQEIIPHLITNLEDRIHEKNISVTQNFKQKAVLYGNKTLIQILISNLLTNAIKYNHKNGSIIISDVFINNSYTLILSNTGLGMNANQVAQIFNRFTRINFEQEGQGIGLAIVDSIANLHQIEIKVTSVMNQVTTFSLRFPNLKS